MGMLTNGTIKSSRALWMAFRDARMRPRHIVADPVTREYAYIVRAPQGHPSTQWRAVQVRRVGN